MLINLLSVQSVLSTITSVLLAILILLIMITVHEFGHYIVGKIFKFKINEFAIGMGPAIFKRKNEKTGELFSIRIFPLGGYCAFEGEDEDNDCADAFNSKKPWQRILVLLAGATMNFILGIIILMISIGAYGQLSIKTYDIKPTDNAVISTSSLKNDDVILKINGDGIFMATDVVSALNGKKQGDTVTVTVKREEENISKTLDVKVILRNDVTSNNLIDVNSAFKSLGVSTVIKISTTNAVAKMQPGDYFLRIADDEEYENCTRIFEISDFIKYVKTLNKGEVGKFYVITFENVKDGERKLLEYSIDKNLNELDDVAILKYFGIESTQELLKYRTYKVKFGFFETINRGFQYSFKISGTIFTTLGQLLTGKLGMSAVGGPITTITTTTNVIKNGGFNYFLEIAGYIGINLAVFNLLPIPALDGSRVVFCVIEWIRKKPVNRKVEAVIHGVGLIVLLGFCILVDILQLF